MVPTTPQHTMQCDDDGDGDGDDRSQELPIRSPYAQRDRLARVSSNGDCVTEHHLSARGGVVWSRGRTKEQTLLRRA